MKSILGLNFVLDMVKKTPLPFKEKEIQEWWWNQKKYFSGMTIGLTSNCQLNCSHCGVDKPKKGKELTLEEIKDILEQTGDLINVSLFGGEPILRKDIFEIINCVSKRCVYLTMSSNGLLITKDNAKKLKKNGLDLMHISIDSPHKEIHDKNRCKESFEKSIQAIKNLKSVGIMANVSFSVTRENLNNGDFERVIQLAKDIGASGIRYALMKPLGKLLHNKEYIYTDEEIKKVRNIGEYPFVYSGHYFANQKGHNCYGMVYKKALYISPYGDISPCPYAPFVFGNIREEHIVDSKKKMYSSEMLRRQKRCPVMDVKFREKYIDNVK